MSNYTERDRQEYFRQRADINLARRALWASEAFQGRLVERIHRILAVNGPSSSGEIARAFRMTWELFGEEGEVPDAFYIGQLARDPKHGLLWDRETFTMASTGEREAETRPDPRGEAIASTLRAVADAASGPEHRLRELQGQLRVLATTLSLLPPEIYDAATLDVEVDRLRRVSKRSR